MRRYTRTTLVLLVIALLLFEVSYLMLVYSGIDPRLALAWNLLSSLDVGLALLPGISQAQPLVLTANLIDAFIFALVTVVLVALFFDFIKQINLSRRIMLSRIRHMKDHIIIVPYNNFAHSLNKEFRAMGQKTVIITDSEAEAHRLYRRGEVALIADPKNIEAFKVAGISSAKYVIACAEDDIQNALISITAKTANQRAKIISRVSDLDSIAKLKSAGAQRMIMPEVTAGNEMGEAIIKGITQ